MVAAVLGWYVLHFGTAPSGTHGRWGEFGDYIGGVLNPGIAFLALVALVWTIHLQTHELKESVSAFARQNFERTFFEMVRLHNDITRTFYLSRVTLSDANGAIVDLSGRQCFAYYLLELKGQHAIAEGESELEITQRAYSVIHNRHQHVLGHYFRNFYRILKFVDENKDIDEESKPSYTGILRAQLSSDELVVMFYSSLYAEGEKLKPFLEKYKMFDNLDPALLIDAIENHAGFYDISAWGERAEDVRELLKEGGS